ncbi:large ribosomal subunit protein uL1m [Trichomonascus vanleenenianus]|uniref:mitochondrial 54S ribosomal protein uL1m MRPL1 n=1 Tax=Trichomonascus vanleenenianus TaxID=2268995 RepID=UPI003ECB3C52
MSGRLILSRPLGSVLKRPTVSFARLPAPGRFASKTEEPGQTKMDAKQQAAHRERQALKEQTKKAEKRKVERLKEEARAAVKSPLCMDIETALRYIRAIEVGRPAQSTTISLNISLIAEKGAALLQGTYRLPRALKEQRIAVFTNSKEAAAEAKKAGATIVGADDLIKQVKDGVINFDKAYATPDMVSRLNQVARILGPKGLMPSAKRGTVTNNIYSVISEAAGETVYKQTTPVLSVPVGRAHFSDYEIIRNVVAVTDALRENINRMDSKKAPQLGKTIITTTRSPPIVIQV